jgi:ribosomal protein S18 acetylase RimI-like enzyme
MPDLIIRDHTPADLPRIKEIICLSFPVFYRFFAWGSVSDHEALVIVCEVNGETAGFAKLSEFIVGKMKCGLILWIAVHPHFRKRGVALKLSTASIRCLVGRGAESVFASTQPWNRAAITTLNRAGFERISFLRLARLFGLRVLGFVTAIWLAPGEVVFMHR